MRNGNLIIHPLIAAVFIAMLASGLPGAAAKTKLNTWFATDVLAAADGHLADVYDDGVRLPVKRMPVITRQAGIIEVDLWVHTHPGDWLVLHVICPRSQGNKRGITVAGRRRGHSVFVSQANQRQWCVCSNAQQAARFIAVRTFLRQAHAVVPAHPSGRCAMLISKHCNFSAGDVIWAPGDSRDVWIKCLIPRHALPSQRSNPARTLRPPRTLNPAKAHGLANGIYSLTNQRTGLLLADPNNSMESGTQMQQSNADGSAGQSWKVTRQSDGFYTIKNEVSGLYLTCPDRHAARGVALEQQHGNDGKSRLWQLVPSGKGFICISVSSGLVMDNFRGAGQSGNPIDLWTENPNNDRSNQTWVFMPSTTRATSAINQVIAAPAVINFTSAPAIQARLAYQSGEKIAHAVYARASGAATAVCSSALQGDLRRSMTGRASSQSRALAVIVTQLQKPSFRPPLTLQINSSGARKAWHHYMIALAVARGNYRRSLDQLRTKYAQQLRQAMHQAINSNQLAEALRIYRVLRRLRQQQYPQLEAKP
jgi:hypothetical protein